MPIFTYGTDYASESSSTAAWTTWTCATSGTSDSATWITWNSTDGTSNPGRIPTTEEREARRLESERKDQERLEAKNRAEELLKLCLTEEQREHLEEMSSFVIESELGKKYCIRKGRVQNVFELDDNDKHIAQLCAHPISNVPDFDTMLAQKLMLETNEAEFLRIANIQHL